MRNIVWSRRFWYLRQKLGLNQIQFAQRLNMSQSAVSKLERGDMSPSGDALVRANELEREANLRVFSRLFVKCKC